MVAVFPNLRPTIWLKIGGHYNPLKFQPELIYISCNSFHISTLARLFLAFVCAQHEQLHTHSQVSE
jgi:hypothetical protein